METSKDAPANTQATIETTNERLESFDDFSLAERKSSRLSFVSSSNNGFGDCPESGLHGSLESISQNSHNDLSTWSRCSGVNRIFIFALLLVIVSIGSLVLSIIGIFQGLSFKLGAFCFALSSFLLSFAFLCWESRNY
jgi:hypothetical protein